MARHYLIVKLAALLDKYKELTVKYKQKQIFHTRNMSPENSEVEIYKFAFCSIEVWTQVKKTTKNDFFSRQSFQAIETGMP